MGWDGGGFNDPLFRTTLVINKLSENNFVNTELGVIRIRVMTLSRWVIEG